MTRASQSSQVLLSTESRNHSRSLLKGFLISYALTALSLAAAGKVWGKAGFDLVVVGMGWPHLVFGFAFQVNGIVRKGHRQQAIFLGLVGLTVAVCVVHSLHSLTTLIYLYFVFHAFRDEIFMYHQRRTGHQFSGRVFDSAGRALLWSAVVVALIGQLAPNDLRRRLVIYLAFCTAALVMNGLALIGWPAKLLESLPGLYYTLPVALLMFLAMTGMKILRTEGIVAPLFFAFLVVFHYFSWYVFSLEKIAAARAHPGLRGGIMRCLGTRRGFLSTVIVLNMFSFAGAYAYQVQQVSSNLAYGFDLKYFMYFLVFHVTTSLAPKSTPKPILQNGLTNADSVVA